MGILTLKSTMQPSTKISTHTSGCRTPSKAYLTFNKVVCRCGSAFSTLIFLLSRYLFSNVRTACQQSLTETTLRCHSLWWQRVQQLRPPNLQWLISSHNQSSFSNGTTLHFHSKIQLWGFTLMAHKSGRSLSSHPQWALLAKHASWVTLSYFNSHSQDIWGTSCFQKKASMQTIPSIQGSDLLSFHQIRICSHHCNFKRILRITIAFFRTTWRILSSARSH